MIKKTRPQLITMVSTMLFNRYGYTSPTEQLKMHDQYAKEIVRAIEKAIRRKLA